MGGTFNNVMFLVAGWVTDAFTSLFAAVKDILVATPDVTRLPQVRTITTRVEMVLDVVFGLVFLAAAGLTMVAGHDERARHTTRTLVPRMVVAFVAAHYSPLLCSQLITLLDAVTTGVSGTRSTLGALSAVQAQLQDNTGGVSVLLFVVLGVIVTVLFAGVALSFVVRLGVLVVLVVTGPLALACHALPQTDPVARLWWRAVAGCLLVPVLQALALQTGETVLLDPASQGLLLGTHASGVLNLLVVIAMMVICGRIPGLVRRYVMRTPASLGGRLLRVVALRHTVRVLTRTTRSRRRPQRDDQPARTRGGRP